MNMKVWGVYWLCLLACTIAECIEDLADVLTIFRIGLITTIFIAATLFCHLGLFA